MFELPMAEPVFYANGLIRYPCPYACGYSFSMWTPDVPDLDTHVQKSRILISDHYRESHGVES